MRIGIDILSIQTSDSRDREIAAYSRHFLASLLDQGTDHSFVLYGHEGMPGHDVFSAGTETRVLARRDDAQFETTASERLERLAQTNPDDLDWLLLLDPFEPGLEQGPPTRPLNGLKMASVVHDLIPFLFQERELPNPAHAPRSYRSLKRLSRYDLLLAGSEATRADCRTLLGMPEDRIVAIGSAGDARFFIPDRSVPLPLGSRREVYRLGIRRSFVLVMAGLEGRKNLAEAIGAFGALPDRLRRDYQLVVVGAVSESAVEQARQRLGPDSPIWAGVVSESTLRVLYQRCEVFVLPSTYEGLATSVLEAMLCGAAVIAGNNSAQVEVVGDAGLLANPSDASDLAAKLGQLLDDGPLAQSLRSRAPLRARQFTWERTAARALDAFVQEPRSRPSTRLRFDRAHGPKPRIAFFSPFPPKISGISDYSARLLEELKKTYTIDLYHDAGYLPDFGLASIDFGCHDYRLFDRNDAILDYRAVVYQMGNSVYHGFLYELMQRRPGVVTLHDFCLAAFQYWFAHVKGGGVEAFLGELAYFCPERADEFLQKFEGWRDEEGGIGVACARRNVFLNRRVFETAAGVAVHSPWCVEQVQAWFPEYVEKTAVIPMGATPSLRSAEQRAAIRDRFDLPREALIFASFGILSGGKMNVEAVTAFEPIARQFPRAILVFVGQEWDGGQTRRKAEELRLENRVRFLGRQPMADFLDLITVADVGIGLRRPPTDGETSAALLDLLRSGIPTIVTDVGTFSSYPEDVVRKIHWQSEGIDGLIRTLRHLAEDVSAREALGRAALRHVVEHHAWPHAAALYVELIERCAARKSQARDRVHHASRPTRDLALVRND